MRYPITNIGKKTIEKAIDVASEKNAVLFIYHVNLIYEGRRVSSVRLRRDVEKNAPAIKLKKVYYAVENSYLLDESILKKITKNRIDVVVMGKSMIPRWKNFIKFWKRYRITEEIKNAANCKVIVVE